MQVWSSINVKNLNAHLKLSLYHVKNSENLFRFGFFLHNINPRHASMIINKCDKPFLFRVCINSRGTLYITMNHIKRFWGFVWLWKEWCTMMLLSHTKIKMDFYWWISLQTNTLNTKNLDVLTWNVTTGFHCH